jgi:predicted aconitase
LASLPPCILRCADGDAFFPALGYLVGKVAEARVPVVVGLEGRAVSWDDLKAFSAAFGSTASVAMFHMAGHTPEAPDAAAALALGADQTSW